MKKEFLSEVLDGIDEKYIKEALCVEEKRMAGLRYRDNIETKGVIDDPFSDLINNHTVDLLLRVEAAVFLLNCILIQKEFLLWSFLSLLTAFLLFFTGGFLTASSNLPIFFSDHDENLLKQAKKQRRLFLILRSVSIFFIVLTALFLVLGI